MKPLKLSLLLIPITFALLLSTASTKLKKKKAIGTQGSESNAHTNPPPPVVPTTDLQPPESNQGGNPTENKNDRWKKADVIINGTTLIVLILTLFAVGKYTLEAGRQTEISRKLFQASENRSRLLKDRTNLLNALGSLCLRR